jgi:adenine-specific DNA-methyltransferase
VLAAAVVEELLRSDTRPQEIQVDLCEIDSRLEPTLLKLARQMRTAGERVKTSVSISIRIGDFLLSGTCGQPFQGRAGGLTSKRLTASSEGVC